MPAAAHTLNRETFRTSRLLDFFSRKELIAQTGHPPSAWPIVVLKELLDNAIDACEDAGIAPTIDVVVKPDAIREIDNGPGIPAETVAGVLDWSCRVSSREAYLSPTRGAQGNALKTLVAMPFVLDGEQGTVRIAACGVRHTVNVRTNYVRQEPATDHQAEPDEKVKTGTDFAVEWPDCASTLLHDARAGFYKSRRTTRPSTRT